MKRRFLLLLAILLVVAVAVMSTWVSASGSPYCRDNCPWPMWHPWYWMLCDQECEPIITELRVTGTTCTVQEN